MRKYVACVAGLMLAGLLPACSSASGGGTGLSASSTCNSYLAASVDTRDAAVHAIATSRHDTAALTPLALPNIDYYCGNAPQLTLGEAIDRAAGRSTGPPSAASAPASGVAPSTNPVALKYPSEAAAARALGPTLCRAVMANNSDETVQLHAVAALTGLNPTDVQTVQSAANEHSHGLMAFQALDANMQAAVLAHTLGTSGSATAISEIESKLGVSNADATSMLADLQHVPARQLTLASNDGSKIEAATSELLALSKIPASARNAISC